jgi:general secretion pathway protein G
MTGYRARVRRAAGNTQGPSAPADTAAWTARGPGPHGAGRSDTAAGRGIRWRGFTLLELMLGIAIVAILAALAIAQYGNYQERVLVTQAIHDIATMQLNIRQMANNNGTLPGTLAIAGHGDALDPWGRPYVYTDLTGPGNGAARKDRRLNPLNSDFDLFSMGKDGVFNSQISHRDSLDDVIRASDGRFIDLAQKY